MVSKTSISFIVLLIIVAVAASVSGYWFAAKKIIPAEKQVFLKLTESKVAQLWLTVSGNITAISGRTIALSNQNESFSVPVKDDAKIELINFLEAPQSGVAAKTSTQQIQFSDLRVGQNASIFAQIQKNGDLSGTSVSAFGEIPQNK